MQTEMISCYELKQLLENSMDTESLLLVDCRPFLLYSAERIRGAANVFCPTILKRRFASKGYVNLENLLPLDIKRKLKAGQYSQLVLYESGETENTHNVKNNNSEIPIILQSLQRNDIWLRNVYILTGGFRKFKEEHPQLCNEGSDSQNGNVTTDPCQHRVCVPPPSSDNSSSPNDPPTELLPHLFIGNEIHSNNRAILQKHGITAILNVSTTCQNYFLGDFRYKTIPVEDKNTEDIASWFAEAIEFIESVRIGQGKVLVHCKGGVSRSATVCLAYLMYLKKMGLEEAFEYVKSRRDVISPNINFMQQLFEFEKVLMHNQAFVFPASPMCSNFSPSDNQDSPDFINVTSCNGIVSDLDFLAPPPVTLQSAVSL